MHYINEINAFGDEMEERPLSSDAQLLWYKLMHRANRNFWAFPLSLTNQEAVGLLGKSRHTFMAARRELEDAGLLKVCQGVKGKPSEYTLIPPTVAWREGRQPDVPEDGVPDFLYDSVDDITRYFGWSDDVGRELAQITEELFAAYWADHKPDDRDRQRVFELTHESRQGEGGEWSITFPLDRKELLAYAFEQASKAGKVNWHYIYGVMKNLSARGIDTLQKAWEYDEERSRRNGW